MPRRKSEKATTRQGERARQASRPQATFLSLRSSVLSNPSLYPVALALLIAPVIAAGVNPTAPFGIIFALISLSLLIHKLEQFARGELSMQFGFFETATLLFLLAACVSLVFSIDVNTSAAEFLRYVAYMMFAWALRKSAKSLAATETLIGCVILGGTAVSWWGIKQYVEQLWGGGGLNWRIFSTFYNPNLLAGYLELTLFLAFVSIALVRERALKLVAGFAFALNFAALLLTGSKGGAAAVVAAAATSVVVWKTISPHASRTSWRRALPAIIAIALVALVAGRPLILRLASATGSEANSPQFRWYLWMSTWRIIKAHPFIGAGLGAFEFIYPRYAIAGFTRMAHENYLQLMAEGGLPLLAVYLSLLMGGIAMAVRLVASSHRETSLWGCGLLASLVAYLVHGLVDYTWYVPAIAISFVAVLSFVYCLREHGGTSKDVQLSVTFTNRPTLMLSLAMVGLFLFTATYAQCRLSYAAHLYEALRASLDQPSGASDQLDLAKASVRLAPRAGMCHAQLANIYFGQFVNGNDRQLLDKAATEYQFAIACEPTVASHYYNLAKLRVWEDNLNKAEVCAQAALHWNPNYSNALMLWGEIAEKEDKPSEARKHYQRIVEISQGPVEKYKAIPDLYDENYIRAHLSLGKLELKTKRFPSAREEFDAAIRWADVTLSSPNALLNNPMAAPVPDIAPSKSHIRNLKAEVLVWKAKSYFDEGNRDAANRLINQALDEDPNIVGLINEVIGR